MFLPSFRIVRRSFSVHEWQAWVKRNLSFVYYTVKIMFTQKKRTRVEEKMSANFYARLYLPGLLFMRYESVTFSSQTSHAHIFNRNNTLTLNNKSVRLRLYFLRLPPLIFFFLNLFYLCLYTHPQQRFRRMIKTWRTQPSRHAIAASLKFPFIT